MQSRTQQFGFTLIELLVIVALVAIVATVAVPSFSTMIQDTRLSTTSNRLLTAIHTARSEALKQSTTVKVCASADGTNCDSSSADWEDGWVVFIDADDNDVVDGGEQALLHGEAPDNGLSVTASEFPSTYKIEYDAQGQLEGLEGGIFTICDDRGTAHSRAVEVTSIGRPGMAPDSNGDGIPNNTMDSSTPNVSC